MQPLSLWPVQMYVFVWDEHTAHQTELKQVCRDLEAKKYVSHVSNSVKQGLYESGFNFVNIPNASVSAWADWVKDSVLKAARHANAQEWPAGLTVSVDLHESWCHITRDGGYHDNHIHPNSSWSGIYYLDCGDMDIETKSGINRFYNPITPNYSDAGTAWATSDNNVDINAISGMMIVFPSWIDHSALPYRGKNDRFILSFNSQIKLIK